MTNILRVVTILSCTFNIGWVLVLYAHVGHLFVPKTWMRILMAGMVIMLFGLMSASYARLGEQLRWWNAVLAVGSVTVSVGLVGLDHWYKSKAGVAHSDKMR